MKYIKCLLSIAVLVSSFKALAVEENEQYARGLMLAVDTRDHKACLTAKERVRLMAPNFKTDICAQDGTNPFSIVVMTIPITEWDFVAEVDMSRKAPRSMRDQTVGFVPAGAAGILFLIPYARENDSNLRLALKNSAIEIGHVRIADLSSMEGQRSSNMSVSFIMKKMPTNYTGDQKTMVERMARRVQISKALDDAAEKEKTAAAVSSLGILNTINTSIQEATSTQNFEIDVFLPKVACRQKNLCSPPKTDTLLPLSLGLSFTIHF